jgi:hypothetical protein
MPWSQSDVDALETAIAAAAVKGWANVQFEGRSMQRYTLSELLNLREVMRSAVSGSSGKVMSRLTRFDKR